MGREYIDSSAVFDETGRYRYRLTRRWRPGPTCVFVMLNPSKAGALGDDATIRRCVEFADSIGCGEIVVVNLFAIISTDPKLLWTTADPIGPENDNHIFHAIAGRQTVIAAWGANHARHLLGRERQVLAMLDQAHVMVQALRVTKGGAPEHPVRLPKACRPSPYRSAA
jgi:hypothetical protein